MPGCIKCELHFIVSFDLHNVFNINLILLATCVLMCQTNLSYTMLTVNWLRSEVLYIHGACLGLRNLWVTHKPHRFLSITAVGYHLVLKCLVTKENGRACLQSSSYGDLWFAWKIYLEMSFSFKLSILFKGHNHVSRISNVLIWMGSEK